MTLTASGAGTLTLGGNNTQTGGLAVGNGLLAITTPQSYSGATTISSGTLSLSSAPTQLPVTTGLSYHLDASSSASLTAASGTLANGGKISAWNDLSTNNVNFTQSTTGMQPTYNASGINGLGTVSFAAGGGSATSSTLVASLSSTAVTVFIVNTPNASNGGLAGIWGQYFAGNGPIGIRTYSSTAWQNGTSPANGNDFTGNGLGFMALNGGTLQAGTVNFTAGVPQVLEAIGNTSLSHTGIYDLGTLDYSLNRALYRTDRRGRGL